MSHEAISTFCTVPMSLDSIIWNSNNNNSIGFWSVITINYHLLCLQLENVGLQMIYHILNLQQLTVQEQEISS